MNLLDAVLAGAAVLAVVGGYRLGFTTRVLSWVGLAVGLVLAIRLVPWAITRVGDADHVRIVLLTLLIVVAGAGIGQALGLWAGVRVAPAREGGAGRVDRVMGALAGLVGLVVLAWVVLPVLAVTPGWTSDLANGSAVASVISERLPEPPDVTAALRSLVGEDNYPKVFEAFEPTQDVGPPPAASGLPEEVTRAVARSVVKVEGVACSRIQDGSGWVVADGLVVTNAHVVAGERSTDIERDDGRRLGATVVAFDPARDLALLQVNKLNRPALPLRAATKKQTGGVFGHPGGEPLRVAPFQVAAPDRGHRTGHLRRGQHPSPGARAGRVAAPGGFGLRTRRSAGRGGGGGVRHLD